MTVNKKIIIQNLPFLIFFWLADKMAYLYRISEGNKIIDMIGNIAEVTKPPLFSFNPFDILIGILGAAGIKLVLYLRSKNAKKYRKGIEYGSARWSA